MKSLLATLTFSLLMIGTSAFASEADETPVFACDVQREGIRQVELFADSRTEGQSYARVTLENGKVAFVANAAPLSPGDQQTADFRTKHLDLKNVLAGKQVSIETAVEVVERAPLDAYWIMSVVPVNAQGQPNDLAKLYQIDCRATR